MKKDYLSHLNILKAAPEDRLPLSRMLELYNHDLSEFWPHDLDMHGEYGYEIDRYWGRPNHYAYIARVDGSFAGFALVNDEVKVGPGGLWVDQFFVLKKYRQSGVGSALARHVFAAHPGFWEVGQIQANLPAQTFWRVVIAKYSDGNFKEMHLTEGPWQGILQRFRC